MVDYSLDLQDRVADEIQSGQCQAMTVMIIDYGQMRDETRVLLGQKVDVDR